ncbi:MAG: hypothetical protein IPM79_33260 [Polyangiaceae bacterium]|nr:hypothetical protein [Polyangiaceae bacterium]
MATRFVEGVEPAGHQIRARLEARADPLLAGEIFGAGEVSAPPLVQAVTLAERLDDVLELAVDAEDLGARAEADRRADERERRR